ncbi:beta-1 3-galactosyltransferase 1 [Biomphalaria glabrata]|uniref:Hexosyltransferase n=1 Tax=Biomphalaria glabrata TaxID=6526 RepID=A0A2C9JIC7_BIOGL|nr:beta-1,3-galactosyltransferase 1-like [Biomphalaria glabrata]XP_013068801.1 beta-1,3-galactosyltransferase 1-like [Biomphalaria glabrata]XP_013068802.1 beta-1,3-galactosyltransferase 1-like [Biomphalaria glabrata]XP_055881929.1 beta-1,3-galactosyltransferase 1-like [Biomphalaria glabrata]XP_055881931.1 beta-1,3-galactosyltransferase 1-like [Biomphalaria glabrata]KAI8739469.1 beta-1; 3-galactosyltransferase 1-like [Biomphalaria glabrata]
MFPRPSRILRLLILLVLLFIVVTSFYMFTSHDNYQDNKLALLQSLESSLRPSHIVPRRIARSNSSHKQGPTDVLTTKDNFNVQNVLHEEGKLLNGSTSMFTLEPGKTLLNPYSFPYIHNPLHICREHNLTFLIYIHSSPVNFKKRQAVRQTWGHPGILSLYSARLVFVLGGGYDQSVQGLVDMEALSYGDIVQEDFIDSYRNLTYKGIAALKWVGTYCANSKFVLKSDDDILIDIVSLIDDLFKNILPKRKNGTRLILCNLWTRMKVIRDPKSKWFISKEEFSGDYFPAYCSGSAFLISSDLAPLLYKAALNTPFFWVDDFYVTGLLVKKIKIQHTSYNDAYLLNSNLAEEKIMNNSNQIKVFHVKKLKLFIKLWPFLLKRHNELAQKFQIHGFMNISFLS